MTGNQSNTMTDPTALPVVRRRIGAYLFTALALVTCPCHLPMLLALLAGTTAGAYLSEHWGIAALALTTLAAHYRQQVMSAAQPTVPVRTDSQEKQT